MLQLSAEGGKPNPANYHGCRHAKEEMQKKKSQRAPRATTGKVFSSNLTTPGISFAAALRGKTGAAASDTSGSSDRSCHNGTHGSCDLTQHEQQTTGQSVRTPNVNRLSLDKMLKVVVQQIMAESNVAVLEKAKIVAINKNSLKSHGAK
jgi:hypothetical protein